jgi:methylation protein EvaC
MNNYRCRISGDLLTKIIDFDNQPLGNGFLGEEDFPSEYFFPMAVGFSEMSMMLQLFEQPDQRKMFHNNYAFFSGTSSVMAHHFLQFARDVMDSQYFKSEDPFVVELGCNDGIMLKHFSHAGIRHLGVEPSENVALVANKANVRTISEFFSPDLADRINEKEGRANVILAANVMCHISEINSTVEGIRRLLDRSGVMIFEEPYLGDVIEKTSYDQIYDEHVFLFSGVSIQYLFAQHEMELIDMLPQKTHGGSMRYVIAHKGVYPVQERVTFCIEKERNQGLHCLEGLNNFHRCVENSRRDLSELLKSLKHNGKRIVGYGATSKSTTVLNYCQIGPDLIEYICDTTPGKQGKYTPGMHIPVKPYSEFEQDRPDYAVLFAWNHAKEIMAKEKAFVQHGGKWITYVPKVKVFT